MDSWTKEQESNSRKKAPVNAGLSSEQQKYAAPNLYFDKYLWTAEYENVLNMSQYCIRMSKSRPLLCISLNVYNNGQRNWRNLEFYPT